MGGRRATGYNMDKQKVIGGNKAKVLSWHQKCMASEAILILTVTTDTLLYEKMNMRYWVFDSDKRYKICMPTGSGSIDCLSPRKLKGHYWSCVPITLGLRVSCLWGPRGDRLPLASLEDDIFIWGKISACASRFVWHNNCINSSNVVFSGMSHNATVLLCDQPAFSRLDNYSKVGFSPELLLWSQWDKLYWCFCHGIAVVWQISVAFLCGHWL